MTTYTEIQRGLTMIEDTAVTERFDRADRIFFALVIGAIAVLGVLAFLEVRLELAHPCLRYSDQWELVGFVRVPIYVRPCLERKQ
jgi:hypothetical protein